MPIEQLPLFSYYNRQRFTQMGCADIAGWYGVAVPDTKNGQALYPTMGRAHIESSGLNVLTFFQEASQFFKTIDYVYAVVGTQIIQFDKFYNIKIMGNVPLGSQVWFAFLPVGNVVYAMFTANSTVQSGIYVVTEFQNGTSTFQQVTDPLAPQNPLFICAFGNMFVVSNANTPDYSISSYNNTDPLTGSFNPATAFSYGTPGNYFPLFNRATGIIRQMCVLHATMYIFSDFSADIWANIPTQITNAGVTRTFPFKLNSSYNWDYGIADPFSLDVDFGRMVWLGKNNNGLRSFMMSNGQTPVDISSQAINVLLQNSMYDSGLSPFQIGPVNGFLYQYENTIFYRASAGDYLNYGVLDVENNISNAESIEFNFSTGKWGRVIELNGERNRIEKHVFFNNMHLVTVQGDPSIFQMAGNIYRNELTVPATATTSLTFNKYPLRYELVTEQIFQKDYSEFLTDYIEIDFVFGNRDFYKYNAPFGNTVFIINENAGADGNPIFQINENAGTDGNPIFHITEDGNTPGFDDQFYFSLFKPNISLYYSDDGGVTFTYADLREFSQLGQYMWRMRWYELGASRNRAYKLICVSSAPIVILGGVQNIRRSSGGAN